MEPQDTNSRGNALLIEVFGLRWSLMENNGLAPCLHCGFAGVPKILVDKKLMFVL